MFFLSLSFLKPRCINTFIQWIWVSLYLFNHLKKSHSLFLTKSFLYHSLGFLYFSWLFFWQKFSFCIPLRKEKKENFSSQKYPVLFVGVFLFSRSVSKEVKIKRKWNWRDKREKFWHFFLNNTISWNAKKYERKRWKTQQKWITFFSFVFVFEQLMVVI